MILPTIDPLIAGGVVATTAFTDAVYVQFNAAVSARRRFAAASWSSVWYLLAAFAVEPFAAFLARFKAHLGLVEKAMGGLLVLTGIAFLTGTVSEFSYWLLDTFPTLGKIG